MLIKDEKRGENYAIITIELDVDNTFDLGKIELTARWQAAGKSLKELAQILENLNLIQIDAGNYDRSGYLGSCKTQEFTFYYGKENENVLG